MAFKFNPLGDPFDYYSEIGRYCPTGATLPTTAVEGQWFLHTPTGRSVLMQYVGGEWSPIFTNGDVWVYVDPTGTDAQDKGFGTGTDAYATIQYAIDQIAPIGNSDQIVIQISDDTFNEKVTVENKSYPIIYIYGTPTVHDSGTLTSASAGSSATRGTITDTGKAWVVNEHVGRFIRIATDGILTGEDIQAGQAYPIISNTTDTVTIATAFGASLGTPIGEYQIISLPSKISNTSTPTQNINVNIGEKQVVRFTYITLDLPVTGTTVLSIGSYAQASLYSCHVTRDRQGIFATNAFCQLFVRQSILSFTGTSTGTSFSNGSINFQFCWIYSTSSNTSQPALLRLDGNVKVVINTGNYFQNFTKNPSVIDVGEISRIEIQSSSTNGNVFWENANTAVSVTQSGTYDTNENETFTNVANKVKFDLTSRKTNITKFSEYEGKDTSPVLVVMQSTKMQEVIGQNGQIGELNSDIRGDSRNISNIAHVVSSFRQPSSPIIGSYWIDNN